jgi:hypothetical protein
MGNHAIVRDEAWDLIDRWQRFLCSDGHCLLRLAGKFEALRQHRQPRDRGSWRHRTREPDLVASALTLTQRQPAAPTSVIDRYLSTAPGLRISIDSLDFGPKSDVLGSVTATVFNIASSPTPALVLKGCPRSAVSSAPAKSEISRRRGTVIANIPVAIAGRRTDRALAAPAQDATCSANCRWFTV